MEQNILIRNSGFYFFAQAATAICKIRIGDFFGVCYPIHPRGKARSGREMEDSALRNVGRDGTPRE
jgi:hypothetical protein